MVTNKRKSHSVFHKQAVLPFAVQLSHNRRLLSKICFVFRLYFKSSNHQNQQKWSVIFAKCSPQPPPSMTCLPRWSASSSSILAWWICWIVQWSTNAGVRFSFFWKWQDWLQLIISKISALTAQLMSLSIGAKKKKKSTTRNCVIRTRWVVRWTNRCFQI